MGITGQHKHPCGSEAARSLDCCGDTGTFSGDGAIHPRTHTHAHARTRKTRQDRWIVQVSASWLSRWEKSPGPVFFLTLLRLNLERPPPPWRLTNENQRKHLPFSESDKQQKGGQFMDTHPCGKCHSPQKWADELEELGAGHELLVEERDAAEEVLVDLLALQHPANLRGEGTRGPWRARLTCTPPTLWLRHH